MYQQLDSDTICAISTPSGVGGIAIIRVIGAGSVVTKNMPDDSVAAGNPAVIIRRSSDSAEELATF